MSLLPIADTPFAGRGGLRPAKSAFDGLIAITCRSGSHPIASIVAILSHAVKTPVG